MNTGKQTEQKQKHHYPTQCPESSDTAPKDFYLVIHLKTDYLVFLLPQTHLQKLSSGPGWL